MTDIEDKIKEKKIAFPKITLTDLPKGMLLRRREEMVNQAVANGFIEDVTQFVLAHKSPSLSKLSFTLHVSPFS